MEGDSHGAPPLNWLGRGENPLAIHRSAFGDPAATFVGIKGGSPSLSHSHMDAGSFVMESDGVRWAVGLGMQDYNSLESRNINLWDGKQTGDRWSIFRLGPESHKILRFNGAPQLVDGSGRFVRFQGEGSEPHSVVDLSSLYPTRSKMFAGASCSCRTKLCFIKTSGPPATDGWTSPGRCSRGPK